MTIELKRKIWYTTIGEIKRRQVRCFIWIVRQICLTSASSEV